VGRSTALVAGILVSSPGFSEMNFSFCAIFITDLRFTKACFTIDSEYSSARLFSSVCNSKSPIVRRGTVLNSSTKYLLISNSVLSLVARRH